MIKIENASENLTHFMNLCSLPLFTRYTFYFPKRIYIQSIFGVYEIIILVCSIVYQLLDCKNINIARIIGIVGVSAG